MLYIVEPMAIVHVYHRCDYSIVGPSQVELLLLPKFSENGCPDMLELPTMLIERKENTLKNFWQYLVRIDYVSVADRSIRILDVHILNGIRRFALEVKKRSQPMKESQERVPANKPNIVD